MLDYTSRMIRVSLVCKNVEKSIHALKHNIIEV